MKFQIVVKFNQATSCCNKWDAEVSLFDLELPICPHGVITNNNLGCKRMLPRDSVDAQLTCDVRPVDKSCNPCERYIRALKHDLWMLCDPQHLLFHDPFYFPPVIRFYLVIYRKRAGLDPYHQGSLLQRFRVKAHRPRKIAHGNGKTVAQDRAQSG